MDKNSELVSSGNRLRLVRTSLGLSLREVCSRSQSLAARYGRTEFVISLRALSELENGKLIPNVYKLHSLAVLYQMSPAVLLNWYRVRRGEYITHAIL